MKGAGDHTLWLHDRIAELEAEVERLKDPGREFREFQEKSLLEVQKKAREAGWNEAWNPKR